LTEAAAASDESSQFDPVSEAGRFWAVWSDVDWPDAVWS
jgi:hypothetical protein